MIVISKTEYDVLILGPNPEGAEKVLNDKQKEGWVALFSYCEDRIVLKKTTNMCVKINVDNTVEEL